jgi:hypothetical protein
LDVIDHDRFGVTSLMGLAIRPACSIARATSASDVVGARVSESAS